MRGGRRRWEGAQRALRVDRDEVSPGLVGTFRRASGISADVGLAQSHSGGTSFQIRSASKRVLNVDCFSLRSASAGGLPYFSLASSSSILQPPVR